MDDKKKMAIVGIASAIIAFSLWLWYGFGSRDNGTRIEPARNELEQAQDEQREQAKSLESAESAITRSTETNTRIESIEQSDAEIIGECQQILDRVRKRNESQDAS